MTEYKLQIAELLIRVFAGILFLFQGYDKLFKVKISGVIDTFKTDAGRQHIPGFLVTLMAYYTSIVEFFGGLLLILGLFTNYTLYLIGFDLLLVCFAFSYMKPMWDMKHVFPRFILVIILLILPNECNNFSFDYLLGHK
jgi:putative oxidoreductase